MLFDNIKSVWCDAKFRKDSPVAHEKHGGQLGKARMKPHRFVTFAGAVGNEGVRHYKTFKSSSITLKHICTSKLLTLGGDKS